MSTGTMSTPQSKPLLFLNGRILPFDDARVHLLSPCVKYGAAVFEGIRGYWNSEAEEMFLFRFDDHARRLQTSARLLGFGETVEPPELRLNLVNLIRENQFRESVHIRATIYIDGFGDVDALEPYGLGIAALPSPTHKRSMDGVRAAVSSWRRLSDDSMPPRIKANGNYGNSRLAAIEAKRNGYEAAILLNGRGKVSEGPSMCIFLVRHGVVVTPSVTSDILESITRDTLITVFRESFGVTVVEREVDRTELYDSEEVFFCGTGFEICPVTSVDGINVGDGKPGPVVGKVLEAYRQLTQGAVAAHPEWRTPVYRDGMT